MTPKSAKITSTLNRSLSRLIPVCIQTGTFSVATRMLPLGITSRPSPAETNYTSYQSPGYD